jgi:anti-sigma28 factor (negative regulator of flagellin synthesis)
MFSRKELTMANEIKLDPVDCISNLNNTKKVEKPLSQSEDHQSDVTLHLDSFVDLMLSETHPADESNRVNEMKRRIQTHGYEINSDELAKKLYQNVFKLIG